MIPLLKEIVDIVYLPSHNTLDSRFGIGLAKNVGGYYAICT